MILSAIAAMAKNRVIGLNNQLPWNLPEDMKYFRDKTKNKIIIMGRKTFDSFGGKPLPHRFHIVITRNLDFNFEHPQVKSVTSLDQAIQLAESFLAREKEQGRSQYGDEVFIIGGGEIYTQSLSKLDRLYLTVIDKEFHGDAVFPLFDEHKLKLVSSDKRNADDISFSFNLYQRDGL